MLLVTVGISGSGKNRLKDFLDQYFSSKGIAFTNVEPDAIRRKMWGDVNEQKNGHLVFKKAGEQIIKGIIENKIVFFNATNTNWSRLKAFVEENTDYTQKVIYIFMMDSLNFNICKQRVNDDIKSNIDRSRVPDDIIYRQYQNFQTCFRNAKDDHEAEIYEYDGQYHKLILYIEKLI